MYSPAHVLKQARHSLKWSQRHLAEASGLDPKTVGNIEAGRTKPNGSTLLAIARGFGHNTWEETLTTFTSPPARSSKLGVPILAEIPASWDRDGDVYTSFNYEEAIDYLPESFRVGDDSTMFGLKVSGDSMSPRYADGAQVACSPRHWHDFGFCDGSVYAIRFIDETTTLKRVQLIDGGNKLQLLPDNPAYPQRTIPASDISVAALVRGVYSLDSLPDTPPTSRYCTVKP